jgi:hypothetical protein
LSADNYASIDTAAAVLETVVQDTKWSLTPLIPQVLECILAFLGRDDPDGTGHERLVAVLSHVDPPLMAPALLGQLQSRVGELALSVPPQWQESRPIVDP